MFPFGSGLCRYGLTTRAADIISVILPEDMHDEIPQGFTQVGHVREFLHSHSYEIQVLIRNSTSKPPRTVPPIQTSYRRNP